MSSGGGTWTGVSKEYVDAAIADQLAASQHWLPAVEIQANLPLVTDTTKTYLCRVRSENNVYQCVAGQTAWLLYSENTDFLPANGKAADSALLNGKADTAFATAAQGTKADAALPATGKAADSALLNGKADTAFATVASGQDAYNATQLVGLPGDRFYALRGTLPNGADLDTYTAIGLWQSGGTATTSTLLKLPSGIVSGVLTLEVHQGQHNQTMMVTQRVTWFNGTAGTSPRVFVRQRYSTGTWSAWVEELTSAMGMATQYRTANAAAVDYYIKVASFDLAVGPPTSGTVRHIRLKVRLFRSSLAYNGEYVVSVTLSGVPPDTTAGGFVTYTARDNNGTSAQFSVIKDVANNRFDIWCWGRTNFSSLTVELDMQSAVRDSMSFLPDGTAWIATAPANFVALPQEQTATREWTRAYVPVTLTTLQKSNTTSNWIKIAQANYPGMSTSTGNRQVRLQVDTRNGGAVGWSRYILWLRFSTQTTALLGVVYGVPQADVTEQQIGGAREPVEFAYVLDDTARVVFIYAFAAANYAQLTVSLADTNSNDNTAITILPDGTGWLSPRPFPAYNPPPGGTDTVITNNVYIPFNPGADLSVNNAWLEKYLGSDSLSSTRQYDVIINDVTPSSRSYAFDVIVFMTTYSKVVKRFVVRTTATGELDPIFTREFVLETNDAVSARMTIGSPYQDIAKSDLKIRIPIVQRGGTNRINVSVRRYTDDATGTKDVSVFSLGTPQAVAPVPVPVIMEEQAGVITTVNGKIVRKLPTGTAAFTAVLDIAAATTMGCRWEGSWTTLSVCTDLPRGVTTTSSNLCFVDVDKFALYPAGGFVTLVIEDTGANNFRQRRFRRCIASSATWVGTWIEAVDDNTIIRYTCGASPTATNNFESVWRHLGRVAANSMVEVKVSSAFADSVQANALTIYVTHIKSETLTGVTKIVTDIRAEGFVNGQTAPYYTINGDVNSGNETIDLWLFRSAAGGIYAPKVTAIIISGNITPYDATIPVPLAPTNPNATFAANPASTVTATKIPIRMFVPVPPATGTVTLQSVNGVLQWA